MTKTEAVEAILKDLTDDNQSQLLPILADALADAGLERQETALRWMILNEKAPRRPNEVQKFLNGMKNDRYQYAFFTTDFRNESSSALPIQFQKSMEHEQNQAVYIGRYYATLEEVWKAFLVAAETHLELLLESS